MTQKTDNIFKQILQRINPTDEEMKNIESSLKKFLEKLKNNIKKSNIDAEVFVGGSFAKKTLIKKDYYDVDIFLRFAGKYTDEEISEKTQSLLKIFTDVKVIHGSRDYFSVKINESLILEIIPVLKVKNPGDAKNITDLSYSHVKYINKKIKSQKILDEIKIAKAFCYANHCYGAESYISGFSGYGLELLVYYYGSFLKFIKAISKAEEKIVIDIEKLHKNKNEVLMDINSSKLQSPIILVDPTYKQRNVLAALSYETFKRFQEECKKFLENPSEELFEIRKTDLEKIKKDAERKKQGFILIEAETEKPEGDVAGSKLLKFYRHLESEISKFFIIRKKGFSYNHKKSARYFITAEKKKEILIKGPDIKDLKNAESFKKKHRNYFTKKGKLYSKEKINFTLGKFVEKWKEKNKKKIGEMSIESVRIIKK